MSGRGYTVPAGAVGGKKEGAGRVVVQAAALSVLPSKASVSPSMICFFFQQNLLQGPKSSSIETRGPLGGVAAHLNATGSVNERYRASGMCLSVAGSLASSYEWKITL